MPNPTLLLSIALMSGLLVTTGVTAQSWGGFYVDGAVGARGTTTDLKRSRTESGTFLDAPFSISFSDSFSTTDDAGETNFLGQLSGGWRWDNGKIVVGVGAFVDLASDDAGQSKEVVSSSEVFSGPGFSDTSSTSDVYKAELRQKNRYGISLDIAPSWRTQPYAKLIYAWSDIEFKESTSSCGIGSAGPTSFSFSNTHSGFGIGGGVRHLYNNNLYFFGEVMWQDLGSEKKSYVGLCGVLSEPLSPGESYNASRTVKVEPSNLTGVIGVGWKF